MTKQMKEDLKFLAWYGPLMVFMWWTLPMYPRLRWLLPALVLLLVLVIIKRYVRERRERIRNCRGVFDEPPRCGTDHEHTMDCGNEFDVCLACRKPNYRHNHTHGVRFSAGWWSVLDKDD